MKIQANSIQFRVAISREATDGRDGQRPLKSVTGKIMHTHIKTYHWGQHTSAIPCVMHILHVKSSNNHNRSHSSKNNHRNGHNLNQTNHTSTRAWTKMKSNGNHLSTLNKKSSLRVLINIGQEHWLRITAHNDDWQLLNNEVNQSLITKSWYWILIGQQCLITGS